jgi:hypothetical protein
MIIKAIKETLGQMFYSPEATGSWVIEEEKIECAIDENTVDCIQMDSPPYVGIPAPVYLEDDEWFGPAPVMSEKQMDYMEMETEIKKNRQEREKEFSVEPDDIHQKMYDIATQGASTTLQLNPLGGSENFQGGSENVHR